MVVGKNVIEGRHSSRGLGAFYFAHGVATPSETKQQEPGVSAPSPGFLLLLSRAKKKEWENEKKTRKLYTVIAEAFQ